MAKHEAMGFHARRNKMAARNNSHRRIEPPRNTDRLQHRRALSADPGLEEKIRAAFARITPLPDVKLSHAGVPEDTYYVVQLDDPPP